MFEGIVFTHEFNASPYSFSGRSWAFTLTPIAVSKSKPRSVNKFLGIKFLWNSPQITSKVVFVITGQMLIASPLKPNLWSWSTKMIEFSAKTSQKFSRMLEWKAGVSKRRCVNQCWPRENREIRKFYWKPLDQWKGVQTSITITCWRNQAWKERKTNCEDVFKTLLSNWTLS